MERAAGPQASALALEGNIVSHHLFYFGGVQNEVYGLLRYHKITKIRNLLHTNPSPPPFSRFVHGFGVFGGQVGGGDGQATKKPPNPEVFLV